jgi:hypothetical protein
MLMKSALLRLWLLLALVGLAQAPAAAATVRQWEIFEIEMTARAELANPYVDGLPDDGTRRARVVFTGVRGEAKGRRYTVAAFWDGERKWKARFAPPAAGEWTYRSASADPGLNGVEGSLVCTDGGGRHGFVRVSRGGVRPGRYFEYTDGTPFLWVGDTWWNWAKKGIRFSTFQTLADCRAEKGFTVGQLYFSGDGELLDRSFRRPDLEQIHKVEEMIAYANSRGIALWIHPWWGGKELGARVGAANLRRWWRYTIDRLAAYNVIWVLAGEYNMYNYSGLGLPFWKSLGAMVRREDPYGHMIGAHPTPGGWEGGAGAPQWSTGEVLHGEPWLDFDQSQVGHAKWRNEMIPLVVAADYARTPAKPVVVTEPWYEFVEGNPPAEDIRFGAWSAMLSGAAGHTYGGGHVWWAHVPEAPSDQGEWPLHQGFDKDTLDYPGAASIGFMARFLKSIEWWKLAPHPELVSNYPARYCAAIPGSRLAVFARWGGVLKLDLRPSSNRDRFAYTWTDLTAGKEAAKGSVAGGEVRAFHAPEDYPRHPHYKDWLLYVRREAGS